MGVSFRLLHSPTEGRIARHVVGDDSACSLVWPCTMMPWGTTCKMRNEEQGANGEKVAVVVEVFHMPGVGSDSVTLAPSVTGCSWVPQALTAVSRVFIIWECCH